MAGPRHPRAGAEMSELGLVEDGAVLWEDGLIVKTGRSADLKKDSAAKNAEVIDAGGRVVLPGFVDSHSHPVFAAPRLKDFSLRIKGLSYQEIAGRGGGILSSVSGVRAAGENELAQLLLETCRRFLSHGTTTLEAKSGYGLTLESELKMLKVVRKAAQVTPLELVPTFLGAHAVPPEHDGKAGPYVDYLIREVLPRVKSEGLAEFADVFCEEGYFPPPETEAYLVAAERSGLKLKLHADQLNRSGGSKLAAKFRAVTADHLDCATAADMTALQKSGTVACLVPGSNFFLSRPYPPARALIGAGVPVALATDFNPGTCPCWNMQAILSIACTQMKMSPEEALVAATVNGAFAVGRGARLGRIEPGCQADLTVMAVKDYRELAYYFGANHCAMTVKKGTVVHRTEG